MHNDVTRRTFLGAISAGAAGVLTGGLHRILAAVPEARDSTFQLGGDLLVNRLGFGAMRLTGEGIWGWPPDRENAKKVLRRAVELGVNFIDTADAYGPETNELLIAEALYPYPKGLVIATKGGNTLARRRVIEPAITAAVPGAVVTLTSGPLVPSGAKKITG